MDAITDNRVERVTWMKSSRVGYTKIINIACGYHIHHDPCPIMIVQPTIEDGQGYSKDEIAPMIRDVPVLNGLVSESKSRDSNNTILKKNFPAGQLLIVGANSARGFRRVSIRILIFDEPDGYPPTAGDEGDQIKLGERRTEYYWNRKIIMGSTPTIKGFSRIEKAYEKSDKRKYYVPCPYCKHKQVLVFANIDFSKKGTESNPVYICKKCSKGITYDYHRWMIENGSWRASRPFKGHAGFHIWAAYSYAPNATWAKIVEEFLAAKHSGDQEELKVVVNTIFGETWTEPGESADYIKIKERAEDYGIILPMDSGLVTCAVDVQDDRFEVLTKAWGRDEESWNIEKVNFYGDPTRLDIWDTLDNFLCKTYEHESGARLRISATVIDTGYKTNEVYGFVKPRESRGVFAIKGSSQAGKPIVSRPSKRNKGKVNLFQAGVFSGKDMLMSRLKITEPGPRYIHNPIRFPSEFFEQYAAEKKENAIKNGRLVQKWVPVMARNETIDLEVYNIVALYICCPDVSMLNGYVDDMVLFKKNNAMGRDTAKQKKKRRVISSGVKP